MSTYDVKLIANEFLRLAKTEGKELTNLQLQNLVYIAHGYHLAIYDKPLFSQNVMAWNFGPVIIDLYNDLKIYGRGVVEKDLQIEHVYIDKDLIKNAECFEKKISKFGEATKPKYTLTHPFAKQEA